MTTAPVIIVRFYTFLTVNFEKQFLTKYVICRHVDCSTQFFVSLQPQPWMAYKYVAFGQLISGEETLKKIEEVPTWYESPSKSIIFHNAGILNMECQDIKINKHTNRYLEGHIEYLHALGETFYEVGTPCNT